MLLQLWNFFVEVEVAATVAGFVEAIVATEKASAVGPEEVVAAVVAMEVVVAVVAAMEVVPAAEVVVATCEEVAVVVARCCCYDCNYWCCFCICCCCEWTIVA